MTEEEIKQKLYEICKNFIEDQSIYCSETIGQADRVLENAYDFIYDICELIGYKEFKEDEE